MRLRNPFIRRVTQHRAVSTLFRMLEPGSRRVQLARQRGPVLPSATHPASPIAALLPQSRMAELPIGISSGVVLPPPAWEYKTPETLPQIPDFLPDGGVSKEPIPTVTSPVQTALQRQPLQQPVPAKTPAPQMQKPDEKAPAETLEKDWPRLRQIMRGHEERIASGLESPKNAQAPAPTAGVRRAETAPPIQRSEAEPSGAPAMKPIPPQRSQRPVISEIQAGVKRPEVVQAKPEIPQPGQSQNAPKTARESQPVEGEITEQPAEITESGQPAKMKVDEVAPSVTTSPGATQPTQQVEQPGTVQEVTLSPQPRQATISRQIQRQPSPEEPHPSVEIPLAEDQEMTAQPIRAEAPLTPIALPPASAPVQRTAMPQATPLPALRPAPPAPEVNHTPGSRLGEVQEAGAPQAAPEYSDTFMPQEALEATDALYPQPAPEIMQALPLEAVWPVQRQVETPVSTPAHAAQPDLTVQENVPGGVQPGERQVRQAMSVIAPEQPTASHVELITPRKPRPITKASVVQKAEEADQTPQLPSTSAPEAETPFSETAVTALEPLQAQALRPTPVSQSGAPVQRQPQSEMVETEIGPLPSDLWRLLGQSPPQPSAKLPASPLAETRLPSKPSAAQKISQTPAASTGAVQRTADAQPVAQNQPTAGAQPAQGTSAVAPSAGQQQNATQQAAAQKPNTDELAQKVYGEIKRRLMIEWERLRKR